MKRLIESMDNIEECGMNASADPMIAPQPADEGMPVSMNISLNASGEKNVSDLINMMKNAGLKDAEPVTPAMMPMRQDMERLNAIVGEPAEPDMEPSVGQEEIGIDDEAEEAYDNAPDPEYADHQMMTKDLSGGLNREKKMHKPAAGGDNAMAIEADEEESYSIKGKSPEAQQELARRATGVDVAALESQLKSKLMSALSEKKKQPDLNDDGKNDFEDVKIARKNAAAKAAAKKK